jgi:hypothetical protein
MNLHYLMLSLSPILTVWDKTRIIQYTVVDLKLASSESAFILPVLCFRVMSNSTFIYCTCTVLVHASASGRRSCSGEGMVSSAAPVKQHHGECSLCSLSHFPSNTTSPTDRRASPFSALDRALA